MINLGIISAEGELWKEQRRFTHTVLKDLGIGRVMLEPKIIEEIEVNENALSFTGIKLELK